MEKFLASHLWRLKWSLEPFEFSARLAHTESTRILKKSSRARGSYSAELRSKMRLVYEIDYRALVTVQEAREVSEIR